jgi:hypothetical protein
VVGDGERLPVYRRRSLSTDGMLCPRVENIPRRSALVETFERLVSYTTRSNRIAIF